MDVLALTDPAGLAWRVLLAYLLGAVPFGFVFCRVLKGVDLRTVGSGNIGATNAMRVLGAPLGLFVFGLDVGKGYAPAAFLAGEDPAWQVACGAAAVAGHVWPVYLGFRGGKAVATGCGAILAIEPWVVVIAGGSWLLCLVLFGWVSVASMAMGLGFPLAAWGLAQPWEVILGTSGLTLLILVRHRSNMVKLARGTEGRANIWYRLRGRDPRSDPEDVSDE